MNLKDYYNSMKIDIDLNSIILQYGYSLSMFVELDMNYKNLYKMLCYSSTLLYTKGIISIYKHALFGIIIDDKQNQKIFVNSNNVQNFKNYYKSKNLINE